MCKELISVIVPVYKVEKYLDECVSSILSQTYNNIEVILVDDGSPDNCPAICDEWAKKDNRIKVVHKENGGVSSARNAGIGIATGNYIGFVDSDDWIEPDMFELLIKAMSENDAQLVSCDLYYDSQETEFYIKYDNSCNNSEIVNIENPYRDILVIPQVSGYLCNKLFKKEFAKQLSLDEELAQNEDLLFVVQYLDYVTKMVHVSKELYHYRMGNIIPQIGITKRLLTVIDAYEKILLCYKEKKPEMSWLPEKNTTALCKFSNEFKRNGENQSVDGVRVMSLTDYGVAAKHHSIGLWVSNEKAVTSKTKYKTTWLKKILRRPENFTMIEKHFGKKAVSIYTFISYDLIEYGFLYYIKKIRKK